MKTQSNTIQRFRERFGYYNCFGVERERFEHQEQFILKEQANLLQRVIELIGEMKVEFSQDTKGIIGDRTTALKIVNLKRKGRNEALDEVLTKISQMGEEL